MPQSSQSHVVCETVVSGSQFNPFDRLGNAEALCSMGPGIESPDNTLDLHAKLHVQMALK